MIDTNILVSAALRPDGACARVLRVMAEGRFTPMAGDYALEEFRRIARRKFPRQLDRLNDFAARTACMLDVVPAPVAAHPQEGRIRDVKDRPIFRAAVAAHADVLVTGDRDLLEAGLAAPPAMPPGQFLRLVAEEDRMQRRARVE